MSFTLPWSVVVRLPILLLLAVTVVPAQVTPTEKADNLASFEIVWKTVLDHHPDPKLNGLDWQAIHDSTRPLIANAQSIDEVRDILRDMLAKLESSHYAIIPAERYEKPTPVEDVTASAAPAAPPAANPTPAARTTRSEPGPEPAPSSSTAPEGALVHF